MKHKHKPDQNSLRIQKWLRRNPRTALRKLAIFIEEHGEKYSVTHVLHSHATKALRRNVITALNLK